jgi:hypothetical protein
VVDTQTLGADGGVHHAGSEMSPPQHGSPCDEAVEQQAL